MRRGLESQLGAGLASVRVHTDAEAAHLTAAHGARALTLGEHVFFAPGRFAPHGGGGAARLAHELVHVLQQRAGRAGAAATAPRAAEAEARSLGAAVAAGKRVSVRGASAPRPQADGPETAAPDADSERSALRHYLRWWLGGVLLRGAPPLPAADDWSADPGTASFPPFQPLLPQLTLAPQLFAPLPPDPFYLQPDAGAIYGAFSARGAPAGAGDSDAAMALYRRNEAIARGLPDLRGMAPRFVRGLIPNTWRRDIASALTAADIGARLNRDFATPIEISDRAFQGMTGASTTVIPLPSLSFDWP
ncbi:MAG TPA: DUF4157 domain-containing protein [Rubrivivax sp.]|nr:DUF4157 domain-containing protein [Rubrivivax sp.]